jgi:hypothetical protein
MSRSRRLFRLIQKKLPGLVLCKSMLVVPPTEHIVRGFLLEATSEKDRVYLWKVVTPLLRPMRHVILNFSTRISGNEPELYVRRDAFEQSAETIRNIISEHIEYLRRVRYPHDFLRHACWVVEGSPVLERFDQALIHYVIGNVSHATKVLRALDQEVDQWDAARQQYIGPLLKQIVREIDKDPARLAALLSEWEQQNVERLGLLPSRVPPDGPRLVISDQLA